MVREIKFRAWGNGGLGDWSRMYQNVYVIDGEPYASDKGYYELFEDRAINGGILEQFTGLRDINGVEIYEGDILKECDHYIWQVSWGLYGWMPFEYNGGGEPDPGDCEVIGNIHENPELLK